jgi:phage portal protein BeeE
VRLEQAMNMSLLTESEQDKYYIKFNLDGLLRGDYKTRMDGYAIGIRNGFMCPNDVRKLENLTLIEGEKGDRFRMNSAMKDIEQL